MRAICQETGDDAGRGRREKRTAGEIAQKLAARHHFALRNVRLIASKLGHEYLPHDADRSAESKTSSFRPGRMVVLQRHQIRDDVLAILGTGNADDHLGPMYISGGIGEIFVELLLVPCDASRFESG